MNISLVLSIALGVFLGLVAANYHKQIFSFIASTFLLIAENISSILSGIGYIVSFVVLVYLLTEEFNLQFSTSLILSIAIIVFYRRQKEEGGVFKMLKNRTSDITWKGWAALSFIALTFLAIWLVTYLSNNSI